MRPGITVIMATHNSEAVVARAVASLDVAIPHDRPFALVVADDGSTDQTLSVVRNAPSRASHRLVVGFPKAGSVGGAKNRAVKLAAPFLREHPWVWFMDDDDEALPGRAVLTDLMEGRGQAAGVGDWLVEGDLYGRGSIEVPARRFGAPMTVIHRDLILPSGNYFAETARDVHDDVVTHLRMERRGVQWCYHQTPPVHFYHVRQGSVSGGRSKEMDLSTATFLSDYPQGTIGVPRSFCTVALGPSAPEAILLAKSLRFTGNDSPLLILTDTVAEEYLREKLSGLSNIRFDVTDDYSNIRADTFPGFNTVYRDSLAAVHPEACLSKMRVIRQAAGEYGNTLFLDADQVVLRPIYGMPEDRLVLSVDRAYELAQIKPVVSWYDAPRYGSFNGGLLFVPQAALPAVDEWERQYRIGYADWGKTNARTGGYMEQSTLDLLPEIVPTTSFHPGWNLFPSRIPSWMRNATRDLRVSDGEFSRLTGVVGGNSLWVNGWPVMTIHTHFLAESWHPNAACLYFRCLELSNDPAHVAIRKLIQED